MLLLLLLLPGPFFGGTPLLLWRRLLSGRFSPGCVLAAPAVDAAAVDAAAGACRREVTRTPVSPEALTAPVWVLLTCGLLLLLLVLWLLDV